MTSKSIVIRQNEDEALILQAAARKELNFADSIDMEMWVAIFFIATLGSVLVSNKIVMYLQIVFFLLSFVVDNKIKMLTCSGARFKQCFDSYVFGWSNVVDSGELRSAKEVLAKNRTWKDKQMTNSGNDNPRGVRNWYECANTGNEINDIKNSMYENGYTDKKINDLFIFLIIIILFVFVSVCYFGHYRFDDVLIFLFITFATPIKKLITTVYNLITVNKFNNEILQRLKSANTVDELVSIQNVLFVKRQIPGVSNYFFYRAIKDKVSNQEKSIL